MSVPWGVGPSTSAQSSSNNGGRPLPAELLPCTRSSPHVFLIAWTTSSAATGPQCSTWEVLRCRSSCSAPTLARSMPWATQRLLSTHGSRMWAGPMHCQSWLMSPCLCWLFIGATTCVGCSPMFATNYVLTPLSSVSCGDRVSVCALVPGANIL
jgi:hypothetical protein